MKVCSGAVDVRDDGGATLDPWALLAALPDPVVVVDADVRLVWANDAAAQWSGWTIEEWEGADVSALVHPDDLLTALSSMTSVQDKAVGTVVELRLRDRAGTYHRFEVRGRSALGVAGVDAVVLCLRDVTDRRGWEIAAGDDTTLRAVIDHAPAVIMLLDEVGVVRGASRALSTLLRRPLETAVGLPFAALAAPEDVAVVLESVGLAARVPGSQSFEAAFACGDGSAPVPMSVTVSNLLDDKAVRGLIVTAVDISSLVEARTRLHHMASHDALTGLPNRGLLHDRLAGALAAGRRKGTAVSVVYGDVDGFKAVNDQLGHRAGDAVLAEVGRRLRLVTRENDTVARMGGDEFAIVIEDDRVGASTILDRISRVLAEPIVLPGGESVVMRLSAGLVRAGIYDSVEDALAAADQAMYQAKRSRTPSVPTIVPALVVDIAAADEILAAATEAAATDTSTVAAG